LTFVTPCQLEARGRDFWVRALNERGLVLLDAVTDALGGSGLPLDRKDPWVLAGTVRGGIDG
jgi:hypothetical protein